MIDKQTLVLKLFRFSTKVAQKSVVLTQKVVRKMRFRDILRVSIVKRNHVQRSHK